MGISAEVIADSISEEGKRITTARVVLPKCLIAEIKHNQNQFLF